MKNLLTSVYSKFFKGKKGEEEVLEAIVNILREKGDNNYYLIPKATLKNFTSSREIDLLLIHPIFGIYVIEVKNWDKLDFSSNNPFEQAKEYKDLILSILNEEFGKIPINVEYKIIFPNISKSDAKSFFESSYDNYQNHTLFKDDLISKNFKNFFLSTASYIPNKKELKKIISLFVPPEKIKEKQIIPIITKDEIVFFDNKQLSILNSYNEGLRIIRGVAGTGKTVILMNFVESKKETNDRFLILCFNQKLKNNIKKSIDNRNVYIFTLMEFLKEINFDYQKIGLKDNSGLNEKYKAFETTEALKEFRNKLKLYLSTHPVDYFLADETQDLPAGFVRMIYEELRDCVLFIDEAQKFFEFSMNNIGEVFKHPKFKRQVNLRGRVKNLKNVYRTPSNISKCAFEILSFDKSINEYYKKFHYLQNDFLNDINFILDDGEIIIEDVNNFEKLKQLLFKLPKNEEIFILTFTKSARDALKNMIRQLNFDHVKVDTMASVKGLEAENIILHNFDLFLEKNIAVSKNIFYRKIYVLLTRAQKRVFVSLPEKKYSSEVDKIVKIINSYAQKDNIIEVKEETVKLSKLKPNFHSIKEGAEMIVTTSELIGIIGKLVGLL